MFRKSSPKFPKLLVFNEKHGDRHYLINSNDDTLKALREVFNQRLKEGWYNDQDMIKINAYFQNAQKGVELEQITQEEVECSVLYSFLSFRSTGEYEGFEFITFDIPEDTKPLENQKAGRDIIVL